MHSVETRIQQLLHEREHLKGMLKSCQDKINQLEEQISRNSPCDSENPIERLKSEQQQLRKEMEDANIALQTTQLQLNHLKSECERLENVIDSGNHNISQMEIQMANLQRKQFEIQTNIDKLNVTLHELRQQVREQNQEVVAFENEKTALFSQLEALQVEMEKEMRELGSLGEHKVGSIVYIYFLITYCLFLLGMDSKEDERT